ncbi:hypothetical protein B0T17DRAFT_507438 [Bombardia bombarda]|uniref:Zn(2)-C6 fungal-type domain-containing protein n=1 Tax=Bombardia bombarda TaxID=252184 RepID=A0AA40CB85_9PEZI|nr:hypothetical protein B0T17DRAFT_507438 [Bombardia bombarda]
MPRQKTTPQVRLACDRCHAHKLRCLRQEGEGGCQRCLRANASCVFSPRQRRAPQTATNSIAPSRHNPATDTSDVPNEDLDLDMSLFNEDPLFDNLIHQYDTFSPNNVSSTQAAGDSDSASGAGLTDWSTFLSLGTHPEFDQTPPAEWSFKLDSLAKESLPQFVPDSPDDSTPSSSSSTPSSSSTIEADRPTDPIRYIKHLADLNVRLYEHAEILPPLDSQTLQNLADENCQLFPIDETFRLTQSFIDTTKHLYPRALSIFDIGPDRATVLLLLSCANRLFDIYDTVFGHMRSCVLHQITPISADGRRIGLPQIRIGRYAPPNPAAITVHMMIFIMMAANLFDQLQEVLGVFQRNSSDRVNASHARREVELAVGQRTYFPPFTEEAGTDVSRRAKAIAGEIVSAREMLLRMPGMLGGRSTTA